jgi:hypothetical protein
MNVAKQNKKNEPVDGRVPLLNIKTKIFAAGQHDRLGPVPGIGNEILGGYQS